MSPRILLSCLALLVSCPLVARAAPAVVGFEQLREPDGTEIGVWYPSTGVPRPRLLGPYAQLVVQDGPPVGRGLPLVVISHGAGGSFAGHADTAAALAADGFVAAALTHPGDNWRDRSRATAVEDRPAALSRLVDFMTGLWPYRDRIDPRRIGAFGFSAGGFTVLAAAGGRPDLSRIASHCSEHPAFYDCRLLREHPRPSAAWTGIADARIRSIVVAAPALGFTFDRDGLRAVRIPVQLWAAGNDRVLPAPFYADAVRDALPSPPEFHRVAGAEHYDFLSPCATGAPALPICAATPDFDRGRFHQWFDAAVVTFFQRTLRH